MEVRNAPDVPCDMWMGDGHSSALLVALLGTADEEAQAKSIVLLAETCQRVLCAQPPLMHVHAPSKIFGDVHGQLRDLLLLFAWYGPSDRTPS